MTAAVSGWLAVSRRSIARYVALTLSLTACAIEAAEPAKPFAAPQALEPAASTGAGGLAQVTLSLILVLAAVFAAAWVVRRLRNFGRFGGGAIEIVADIALGAKERAVLVQVGKQQLLLGVTANQVNTLHVLSENVVVRPVPNPPSSQGGGDVRPEFKAILKRSLGL